jgi:Co/Zn/Cd efflux system component
LSADRNGDSAAARSRAIGGSAAGAVGAGARAGNLSAVYLHFITDGLSSVAVIVSSLFVKVLGWTMVSRE